MTRLIKFLFLFVILPIAILFLAGLVAFQLIPQEKLRAMASERIGQRLHRQIELGPMHLGLGGLDIDDLQLSEIPNFHAGTVVTAKGVKLGWDLGSLWRGLDFKTRSVTRSSGRFHIDQFHNPHYSAQDFSLTWSLSDIDPTWSHLNGKADLEQGKGLLLNINQLITTTPTAKLALTPVTVLMNLDHLGFINLGLPNLERWPIQSIKGDYLFKDGVMKIERFEIMSAQLNMAAAGAVELGTGIISIDVALTSPPEVVRGVLDVKMHVSGTVSHPKMDLQSLKKKAFKATITNLLRGSGSAGKDVNDQLKKLFR